LEQLDYAYFRLSPVDYARSRQEMEMLRRPPASVAELRRQLGPSEHLIEFVLDAERSYALEVSQAGLAVHTLAGRAQIDRLVSRFLSSIKKKEPSSEAGQMLYQQLLLPIVGKSPASLIIVPDSSLHLLPFGALVDERGASINSQLTLTVVPSATVYFTLKTAAQLKSATRPFLGVAYSQPDPQSPQPASNTRGIFDLRGATLPPLRFGGEEITEAANLLGPGSVILDGERASEAAVKAQQLRDFKIIHFAAHAVGNEAEPDRAAIVLAPGSSSEDGLWQAREIRQSRLNADVVVLSACETGVGRLEGQEGIMNLARAFLAAGARSVVASLWEVDDRSTATLMELFYERLATGLQVRDALHQAQLDFVRNYQEKAQPYYWAGFEVIGDGSRQITVKANKADSRPARADIR